MSYTVNDEKFRKQHKHKLTPHQEIAELVTALKAAPHQDGCKALTPRGNSISAFFAYKPPNCTCCKAVLSRYIEADMLSDHEFKY